MIITETVSSPVISNVAAAPSRFKIKASAKAFKILSGFYSEPILAIPRELGANAWDSHVKAGNTDKMFEVHVPNTLEPWFSVRDFGTGLSPEAIDTIYTTYFESTKTADNDSDGCMGLGSKTPFNYTDNFNVTSFQNGKKYVYNCFIDEQGAPNIMQVAVVNTTEHNGLEIKFGVKISDISMWVDKITRAYEPFRHRPAIKGAKIEYKSREYIYQGNNWAIRKNQDDYYNRGSNAFMGNYCYPINSDAIRRTIYNLEKDNAYKLEQAINYGNFDLFFNIGDLDVAPNKEQLQYEENNSTCVAIVNALKVAIAELKQQVLQSVETPKSRWEAMALYNKYNGYNSSYANVRTIIGGEIPINFNGEKIAYGDERYANTHKNSGALLANGTISGYFELFHLDTLNGNIKRATSYIPPKDGRQTRIFYSSNTLKKARLRHHLATKYTDGKIPSCYIILDASNGHEILNKHKAYFGWDDSIITEIESLPKPPVASRTRAATSTDEIFVADIGNYYKTEYSNRQLEVKFLKKAADFDDKGTYYYVDFLYNDVINPKDNKPSNDLMNELVRFLVNENAINHTAIYGINKKNAELLETGKWINLFDVASNIISANTSKYEQELHDHAQFAKFYECSSVYNRLNNHPSIVNNIKNDDTRDMFSKFVSTRNTLSRKKFDSINLIHRLGVVAKNHAKNSFDLDAFKAILQNKYLDIFASVQPYADCDTLIYTFINMIDEKG